MKKYKNTLINEAKNSIGLGMTSITGMGIMGSMKNITGMPIQSSQVINTTNTSLNLLNVGQLSKTGLILSKMLKK